MQLLMNGQHRTRHERSDEHTETAAGAVQQLQPEVPPATRGMGEAAAFVFRTPDGKEEPVQFLRFKSDGD